MKRVLCLAALAIAASASAAPVAGASQRSQKIAQLNRTVAAIQALNVPGGVIGVTGDGIGRYTRAFGLAAPGVPMSANREFRIASMTKTFTGTVILELVDRGKLKLSDTIERWEPRVPYARIITIAKLLNMTSSIYDEGGPGSLLVQWESQNCIMFQPSPACSQTVWTPQRIINMAIRQGAQYRPGVWNYSDTNYVLLQLIAQRVTHEPFARLVKQLITDPLHLHHTVFATTSTAMRAPATVGFQLYPIYNKKGEIVAAAYAPGPLINPSALAGAGAIISNLPDLQVWAKALATGTLLKPQTQRLRLQGVPTGLVFPPLAGSGFSAGLPVNYGLGVASLGGMLGHNGEYGPLYTSDMWYSPARHGSVIVLLNSAAPCAGGQPIPDVTATTLARIAYGGSLQRSSVATPVQCQSARRMAGG